MTTERAMRVEAQTRAIRAALLARHGLSDSPATGGLNQRPGAVEEAARLSVVNAHWGIASDLPIIGPILVLARRAARLALRWYINPIVEQQNAFNEAVVRALYELETENYELRSKIAQPEIREH